MSGVWGESACGCIGEVRKDGRVNDLGRLGRSGDASAQTVLRSCTKHPGPNRTQSPAPMGSTERDASGQMGPQSCASRNYQALNSSSITVEMTIRSVWRNGAIVRPRSAVPTFRRSFARRSVSIAAATALSRSMVPRFRFGRKVG